MSGTGAWGPELINPEKFWQALNEAVANQLDVRALGAAVAAAN